ncbi:MAG: DUF2232 domain-containing protein [Turneriella sp.]
MEALLGFPLSLAFALIPIYLYRPEFNRRLWLSGVLALTAAFFFLPWRLRIEAFMPGGAAIFFLISGIWVVALNPTSSIFKLLNMPLPSRKELKAEIEKVPDAEGRVQKYLALTTQLKKIWQKRDMFLSGYNSALLLTFTIVTSLLSFAVAAYEYHVTGNLRNLLDEVHKQVSAKMQAGAAAIDLRAQLVDMSPVIFVVSSFTGILCLGVFLRIFARIRFKQNVVQGHMSLFRIPDSWVWGLIAFAGLYVLGLKVAELKPFMFYLRNGLLILLFLYMLQGIGLASLFFEVRLMPAHWIALGIMLTGIWLPELLTLIAVAFTVLGLMEVWLSLRKRSLRPVTDSDLS